MLRVEGARRLRKTMRQAGADMTELKALNRSAAQVVATAARATSPVGPPKGGHIKSTIRVGATQAAGIVRVGGKAKPYAGPLHWGRPGGVQKAQPWVSDAAQDTENTWVQLYVAGLERALEKVEGK